MRCDGEATTEIQAEGTGSSGSGQKVVRIQVGEAGLGVPRIGSRRDHSLRDQLIGAKQMNKGKED